MGVRYSCIAKAKVDDEYRNNEYGDDDDRNSRGNSEYRYGDDRDDDGRDDDGRDGDDRDSEYSDLDRDGEDRDGEDDDSNSLSLVDLPAELLVRILYYLPTRDRLMMRHVAQRFQDVGGVPLLWKHFVWSYRSHHTFMVSKLLKLYGEHVRQLYIPTHVMPSEALEMLCYCTKMTYLMVPEIARLP